MSVPLYGLFHYIINILKSLVVATGDNMAARGEFYKMQFLKRWNTSQFVSLHLKHVGMVNYCT